MLALAEKNNPTATFELLDCRNIREIKNKFDAVVCGFCLPYLSETDGIKLIKDSYQLLHHDGLIYISIIEGDYSQSKLETSSDGQHSMFVHYFSEAFMTSTLEANHFSIVKIIRIAYARGNSEPSVHIVMIAKKR
jgi:predicted TPR repeat methyltransferase